MVDTETEAQTTVHGVLQPEHQHYSHAQIGGGDDDDEGDDDDNDDDDDDDNWLGSREAC